MSTRLLPGFIALLLVNAAAIAHRATLPAAVMMVIGMVASLFNPGRYAEDVAAD